MARFDKPNRSNFFIDPIYDQMAENLQLNGKGQRTVHGCLRAVRHLADQRRKAPEQITETELRRESFYFREQKQSVYRAIRAAISRLQLFRGTTCTRNWNVLSMPKPKNNQ